MTSNAKTCVRGKPKRRTRERILETALAQFNLLGEPTVTTSAIAAEMGISQGNLYYHFRNKEEIVLALLGEFELQTAPLLDAMSQPTGEPEDVWLFLHLMFESIWRYRFFYYDISTLMSNHRQVESHFRALLARKQRTAHALCLHLEQARLLNATAAQMEALSRNLVLVGTFWISYQRALNPRGDADIALGVYQVMQLVAPYLRTDAREHLQLLAEHYTSQRPAS